MSLSRGVGLFLGVVALGAAIGSATSCKKDDTTTAAATSGGNGEGGSATSTGTGGAGGTTKTTSTSATTGTTGKGGSGGAGGSGGSGGSGGGDPCGGCPDGKVCDPGLGCVECFAVGDCKDAAKPVCAFGSCVACGTQYDCKKGEICSQYDHTCTTACGTDTDCKSGSASLCDPTGHFCAECTQAAPCPTQGGTPKTCFGGRCVKCYSQAQCSGATPVCDPSAGECVQCLANAQCADGDVCQDHTCTKK